MKLVGFSGRKQSGKDSAIEYLQKAYIKDHCFTRYAFGDKLKDICIEMFGLTHEQCYGTDEQKNTPTAILWQDMPHYDCIRHDCNLIGEPHPYGPMTARAFMQVFGSDIMRKIFGDVWVRALMLHIDEVEDGCYGDYIPDIGFIADVRFPNEVKAIHDRGGKVYRLTRNIDPNDKHKSETELDNYKGWDGVIDNQDIPLDLKNEKILRQLIAEDILPPRQARPVCQKQ